MRPETIAKLAPVAGFMCSASLALALGSLILALTSWPWAVWLFSPLVFFVGGAFGTAIERGMMSTDDEKPAAPPSPSVIRPDFGQNCTTITPAPGSTAARPS
jgi:branched-subunit amino acid ABC-type transport system permease component